MSWVGILTAIGLAKGVSESIAEKKEKRNKPPTRKDTLNQAAKDEYGQQAKIDNALQAVLLDDARQLLAADREDTRRFKNREVFGDTGEPSDKEEDTMGDLIVAENYKRGNPVAIAVMAVTSVVAVSLLAGFIYWVNAKPTQSLEDTDTTRSVTLEKFIPSTEDM